MDQEQQQDQEQKQDYDPGAYKPERVNSSKPKSGFLRTLFIVIGVIAVIIIIMIIGAIITLMVVKPFGLDITKFPTAIFQLNSDAPSNYDHPLLSTDQEKILESFGVNTANLPTGITSEMEKCATDALGKTRIEELKAGATPSLEDYLQAKDCL